MILRNKMPGKTCLTHAYTEKYFRNLVDSTRNQIVFTILQDLENIPLCALGNQARHQTGKTYIGCPRTRVSLHNGDQLLDPLKPLNTIVV